MEYTPISPFMRPVSLVHLHPQSMPARPLPDRPVGKWALLRDLAKGQAAFGVSERELTVLQALLSFFPHEALGGEADQVVFASNKAICERLHGMPCSTMRRHLAHLIEAGLLSRRDSPNGKRYRRRYAEAETTFGIDLSPLHRRAVEIAEAAEAVRAAEERAARLRETVSLMRRDLTALAAFGTDAQPGLPLWERLREVAERTGKMLRRKLSLADLTELRHELEGLLEVARNTFERARPAELGTRSSGFEHHQQKSEEECSDLEHIREAEVPDDEGGAPMTIRAPRIPLDVVVAKCPSLSTVYPGEIRYWHHLYDAAQRLRPILGISPSAWAEAQRQMGAEQAAIVLAAILQRFESIRSPGGYLRALTAKAASGSFSCAAMVMALGGRGRAA